MNQQDINIFLAIVEHQSISAAARELHYSQQTVSEHLSQLEKKLGRQLIQRERGSRKISLTSFGEDFLPFAKQHTDLQIQIARLCKPVNPNVLRLGSGITGHEYILSPIMYRMLREHPEFEIQIGVINYMKIPLAVSERSFDVVFQYGGDIVSPYYKNIHVFDEERCILCPADTPLPDRLLSIEELPPAFEVRFDSFRAGYTDTWRRKYFSEDIEPFARVDRLLLAYQYMTDPRCWLIAPASSAVAYARMNPEKYCIRRIEPAFAPPPRPCHMMILKSHPETQSIQKLLQYCGEYAEATPYLHKPSDI